MDKFERHRGVAAPMLQTNIDTDAIIPSREMKRVSKRGLGEGLFAVSRYRNQEAREPNPDFVLNQPAYHGASIILAGANFGCGSSREHAVWALGEYGIRAIIAPSFGAIFANNCVRNGLLPIELDAQLIGQIARRVALDPQQNTVLIDLPQQLLGVGSDTFSFELDNGSKQMLIQGFDAITLTLTHEQQIKEFHDQRQKSHPWLYTAS